MKFIPGQRLLTYKILWLTGIIIVSGLLMMACSEKQQTPPSEEVIRSTISNYSDMMAGLNSNSEVKREVVEVIDIAPFNKKEGYWPVKVKMRAQTIMHNLQPGETSQPEAEEQITTIPIFQDNNGNWGVKE
jgi:hypothetical protein